MNKILLCTRDNELLGNLESWLMEPGYQTIAFVSTADAVACTFPRLPRLAVMDLQQLDNEGLSAIRRIYRRFAIPVILIVDTCSRESATRAAEAGVCAMLKKPIKKEDVLAAVGLSLAATRRVQELKNEVRALKESLERKRVVEQAKGRLMELEGLTEAEAFRKMQKVAMDRRIPMRCIAEFILFPDKPWLNRRHQSQTWKSHSDADRRVQ